MVCVKITDFLSCLHINEVTGIGCDNMGLIRLASPAQNSIMKLNCEDIDHIVQT